MVIISIQSYKNKEKFSDLIEQNKLRFYKTAKSILKNDDDVYDALQEALISIYQNLNNLKNEKYFATWATRIVINKCYDLIGKNKNSKIISIEAELENDMKNAKYDDYDVDQYGIKKAMEFLNEDLRLITILYYYDNFSIKEISKIMDIPNGTVKSRLYKARAILKEKLEKEEI